MDDEDIICEICFKSFANSAIGTAVPCGHMFHIECFETWADDRYSSRKQSPTHCPSCNKICSHDKPFIRLYLKLDDNNDCQINDLDYTDDTEDEIMNMTDASKNEGSAESWQGDRYKIRLLQERIKQLDEIRFDLMDKVQQLETQILESTVGLDALTSEIRIIRKNLKNARFELKTINLASKCNNEKLQKSQKQSKLDLDMSRKILQTSQNQAKATHRALAMTSKQFEELSQKYETLLAGSSVKQGMHAYKRFGKIK